LAEELSRHIEHEHWHVDRRGDGDMDGPAIEEWTSASAGDGDAHDEALRAALRTSAKSDAVGIFNVSHIGGHRCVGARHAGLTRQVVWQRDCLPAVRRDGLVRSRAPG